MFRFLLLLMLLLTSGVLQSQDQLTDFDTARRVFWELLYPAGGWTLYCGLRFEAEGNGDGVMATIDHIYPMPRVYKQLKCGSRLQCKKEKSVKYNRIEADLHNMYPASGALVIARSDTVFGEISGNESRYEDCNFESKNRMIEPRDIAKGNIARSLLYMHAEYDLELAEDIELLKAWSRADPPSEQEISRNRIIEQIQGNRNPFIDKPELVSRF